MATTTLKLRIVWVLLTLIVGAKAKNNERIKEIVGQLNRQQQTEINVFINLKDGPEQMEELNEILKFSVKPKVIITESGFKVRPLYELCNKESLTIAWLTRTNVNGTLAAIDRLLWKIHFKNIFLIFDHHDHHQTAANKEDVLKELFQLCWLKGFISVMVWLNDQLYTYHPYPSIKVVPLLNVAEFKDKSHLNNFQEYRTPFPFVEFPPLCFSYTTRQGQLVRAGYFYKWVETFLKHHNATIDYYIVDMWANDFRQEDAIHITNDKGYTFVPIYMPPNDEYYERSNVLYITKGYLLVPSAQEIAANLYLLIPFDGLVWSLILLSALLFFVLLIFINRHSEMPRDFGKFALQALTIIVYLSSGSMKRKTLLYYNLQLLFLFTGVFLTNYYSSSLSSLYTSKVFEPELQQLTDISRNNLIILAHSADVDSVLAYQMPELVKQRIRSGDNSELFENRHRMNMSYMYLAHEELLDNIMFQQYYLKHGVARKLDQIVYERPQFVVAPHRSPMLDQFNRYLAYISENGLLQKIAQDAQWDGVLSGHLKIMRDVDDNVPLKLLYFLYGFCVLIFGWLSAFVIFVIEILIKYKKHIQLAQKVSAHNKD